LNETVKAFLVRWLLGSKLEDHQRIIDSLVWFAGDTCDVVNPLIVRIEKLENANTAPKTVPRRLRVKHK
jgi:hypothetical protein